MRIDISKCPKTPCPGFLHVLNAWFLQIARLHTGALCTHLPALRLAGGPASKASNGEINAAFPPVDGPQPTAAGPITTSPAALGAALNGAAANGTLPATLPRGRSKAKTRPTAGEPISYERWRSKYVREYRAGLYVSYNGKHHEEPAHAVTVSEVCLILLDPLPFHTCPSHSNQHPVLHLMHTRVVSATPPRPADPQPRQMTSTRAPATRDERRVQMRLPLSVTLASHDCACTRCYPRHASQRAAARKL